MNSALSKFMGVAITAVVIVALVFGVLYDVVDNKTTSDEGYYGTIDSTNVPSTDHEWQDSHN
ncbi:hypothetical protein [Desertibacillus haloalkaliphilus]|uniref:hypothetical protein n=1 Tax=Desertibacillus haloalkaliphilus TaxID=1328930 RepID=UPI001C277D87|nr:hypothetical protein [Desertibacillus haloalkaliphilus]MBU8908055.1 hypothetical protein [Desertibacillus haloalkaliphilus]